jgi:hypothetical protein
MRSRRLELGLFRWSRGAWSWGCSDEVEALGVGAVQMRSRRLELGLF